MVAVLAGWVRSGNFSRLRDSDIDIFVDRSTHEVFTDADRDSEIE